MRILIGNHIDPAIRDRGDLRAWTQRVLWFARDGDLVVMCTEPDQQFLHYVASLTGTDPQALRILITPPGRHGGLLLDPESLTSDEFLDAVRDLLGEGDLGQVEEVFALWPSASVSRFSDALGIGDRFPGAGFFAQGGGELANSKATFRALAAAAGVSIPAGAVCRSETEAIIATIALLGGTGAVVVKQAHNGAGVGNDLLLHQARSTYDHVGARHLHQLTGRDPRTVAGYWDQRWDWASASGRFPVVVEEFTPHQVSVYSEHYATDTGTHPTQLGMLVYVGRRLSHQIVPLPGMGDAVRVPLLQGGTRLAEAYRAVGYRGHLSADAIITADGRVVFTEVNAQVSGSLHIYQVIAHRIVQIAAAPHRFVVEYHVPPAWAVPDVETFLAAVGELGCGYDPSTRTGVIVSMPASGMEPGRAQFVFCLAYRDDAERQWVCDQLDTRFTAGRAGEYGAPAQLGVPSRPACPATARGEDSR